ncbi:hypothetical protein [Nocardia jinanensis]|uniref:Uncharacterized protein n=1 Tax=Nocardia jinanensis TaxID=382504 RepID=A0A917RSV2_9NOCA|nr:hypothetical protein [Nocardia jinanensis]GGL25969.1 hypothetical protein GCM10011588_45970 [Nocardia jinanensis]
MPKDYVFADRNTLPGLRSPSFGVPELRSAARTVPLPRTSAPHRLASHAVRIPHLPGTRGSAAGHHTDYLVG